MAAIRELNDDGFGQLSSAVAISRGDACDNHN